MEVEEGFLDGLSLEFSPGLNVIIGPRGVGKTSVVELIRFTLGISGFTDISNREARQHAISVLEGGRSTVVLRLGEDRISFTRSADEDSPRTSGTVLGVLPTVLSQREIERVGLDAIGRLRLIDAFRLGVAEAQSRESSLHGLVRSQTLQMRTISSEITEAEEQAEQLRSVPDELKAAEDSEAAALATVSELQADRERLSKLSKLTTDRSVQQAIVERGQSSLEDWLRRIEATLTGVPDLEEWPESDKAMALPPFESRVSQVEAHLRSAISELRTALNELQQLGADVQASYVSLQDEARQIRRRLDEIQKGAGELTRQVSELRERAGQLEALRSLASSRRNQLEQVQEQRKKLLDDLDDLQGGRYEERDAVVTRLNEMLGPRIHLEMTRFGLQHEYAAAIIAALRGSGLHHNTLAPIIASTMSPRELAEAVERGDSQGIASLADIPLERAQRVVAAMTQAGVQDILTARVEDAVTLSLLDGGEYKSSDHLSTGQRCTVILPIILSHENRVVILDQPEDHLDNAFIVDTVVDALTRVRTSSQMIISSHNANIPVLGAADEVILLGSDGERGFVRNAGSLEEPAIVDAITSVMEGGREAFQRRADFYRERLSQDRG